MSLEEFHFAPCCKNNGIVGTFGVVEVEVVERNVEIAGS